MKQQIFIVLFSVVITACYGQDAGRTSDKNRGLNSSVVENYSNHLALGSTGLATEVDAYLIIRSTLGVGGFSKTITTNRGSYVICQSIGQTSVIGTYNNNNYTFMQGYQQPLTSSRIFQLPVEKDLFANLYPNPFYHYINISFNDPITEDILISLTDIAGKIIFLDKYPASQLITLHLDHFNCGIYILKVVTSNKQFRANIIKQYQ